MDNLYNRLDSLCKERGVKGGKMCTDIGVSKSLMTDLKMGRKKTVNVETAKKIAEYFGVSVEYLLGGEKKESPDAEQSVEELNEVEEQLVTLLRQLPPEHQKMVPGILQSILDSLK